MRDSAGRMGWASRIRVGFAVSAACGMAAASGLLGAACDDDPELRVVPQEDGGRTPTEAGSVPVVEDTCPSPTPIDIAKLAWKPATPAQSNRCQEDDLAAMREFVATNPSASNEDFENFVKNRDTTCHACIFADANGATWPPMPLKEGKVTFNVGACYAVVTGRDACGKAVQNAWDCEHTACAACASAADVEPCRVKARTGVCKATFDASRIECSATPISGDDQCGTPFDSVRAQCMVPVPPDSGADGGDGG